MHLAALTAVYSDWVAHPVAWPRLLAVSFDSS